MKTGIIILSFCLVLIENSGFIPTAYAQQNQVQASASLSPVMEIIKRIDQKEHTIEQYLMLNSLLTEI